MTKPRDAAHQPQIGESSEPLAGKKVDLHRYQVMTIPMELQQELASLKGPRLTDEDLKPLPPIGEVAKAHQASSSNPPALHAKALQFGSKRWVLILGTVLGIALGFLLLRPSNRQPRRSTSIVAPAKANQSLSAPTVQAPTTRQPTDAPPSTHTPQATTQSEAAATKTTSSLPTSPAHPQAPYKAVSPAKPTTATPPATDPSVKPRRRVAFKPE